MWSGPRNISTAMMRAWGSRADTAVVDEPFYAHYLAHTGAAHPGAEEVIAHGETNWRNVVEQLLGSVPHGRRVFYQKQMTHHLLPHIGREWLLQVTNCFLIRDPQQVILSYLKKNGDPTPEDIGFPQQAEIFDFVQAETGATPPVVDAADVLQHPRETLQLLCAAVGVEFTDAMLTWAPGLQETDGVWAKHWYHEVVKSTGFQPYSAVNEKVPERLRDVLDTCAEIYHRLREHRLCCNVTTRETAS
jgi:hypothetical protein